MANLARRTSLIVTLILPRTTWANSFGLDTGKKGCVVEPLDAASEAEGSASSSLRAESVDAGPDGQCGGTASSSPQSERGEDVGPTTVGIGGQFYDGVSMKEANQADFIA